MYTMKYIQKKKWKWLNSDNLNNDAEFEFGNLSEWERTKFKQRPGKKTVFSTIVQNLKNVPFAFQVQIEI